MLYYLQPRIVKPNLTDPQTANRVKKIYMMLDSDNDKIPFAISGDSVAQTANCEKFNTPLARGKSTTDQLGLFDGNTL